MSDAFSTAWLTVESVRYQTRDTFDIVLRPPGGFRFEPGQFNMLYALGAGEVPISIAGDPARPSELFHTIRAVGRVTRKLGELEPGQALGVRGPYGRAWPIHEARGRDLVLVAGGIGLAPLRPVLLAALGERAAFGRIVLCYGARTPGDLLYGDELAGWRALGIEVAVIVDRGDPGWTGETGVVTKPLARLGLDPARSLALLCGPEIMMRFAGRELERQGLPREQIWVSLERSMKCGTGLCGHCQLGPLLLCRDGAPVRYDRALAPMLVREL
jgi:NAD(P)H-flavin reductase